MGAAEFEFGALGQSLKLMRSSDKLELMPSFHDPNVNVLGEPWAVDAFELLRHKPRHTFKEDPEFPWGTQSIQPRSNDWMVVPQPHGGRSVGRAYPLPCLH